MCDVHAEDTSGHVADNADEVARLVVEDARLVTACSTRYNEILLAIEHCRVEHRGSLRLELLHVFFFIVFNVYLLYDVAILVYICFSSIEAVPFVSSDTFHGSNIKKLESIILSITACEDSITIVPDINGITADMRAIYACNWSLLSDVVNLHCVIPSTGQKYVWIDLIKLN